MRNSTKKNDGKYNSKANTVCILKILEAYSNGDIILPMSRIIELMESVYKLHVDRRTVYSSITILQNLGYSIETYDDNGIGYALTNKPFDTLEIKLLIDSVRLNSVIPRKNEKDIIDKLMKFIPNEDKRHFTNRVIGSLKKESDMTPFFNLDTIDLAIQQRKKIELDYKDSDNTIAHYIVTPMSVIMINYHYYVICSDPDKKQNIIFRIGDIKNLYISDEDSSPYTYFKGYSMLNPTGENFDYNIATLRCSTDIEKIFHDTFDSFLFKDRKITYCNDNEYFIADVYGSDEAILRWALSYMDKCEIIEPQSLRDEICVRLKNNPYTI